METSARNVYACIEAMLHLCDKNGSAAESVLPPLCTCADKANNHRCTLRVSASSYTGKFESRHKHVRVQYI